MQGDRTTHSKVTIFEEKIIANSRYCLQLFTKVIIYSKYILCQILSNVMQHAKNSYLYF